jgi:hypothetical protein
MVSGAERDEEVVWQGSGWEYIASGLAGCKMGCGEYSRKYRVEVVDFG